MPLLTQKQADILGFIKEFISNKGFSPTRVEMADAFKIQPNAAQGRVEALIRKGAVTQELGKMRSIIPVKGFRVRIK